MSLLDTIINKGHFMLAQSAMRPFTPIHGGQGMTSGLSSEHTVCLLQILRRTLGLRIRI
jgi:hypothetical protein